MESTDNVLNKVVNISYNIFLLYRRLSGAEIKYGKDSEEYKKISSYIEMSSEEEDKYFSSIIKDKKTIFLLREFWDESYSGKTVNPFQNSFCTLEKENNTTRCTKRIASRVQSELDLFSDVRLLSSEFNLNILKNYVILLDRYILETSDSRLKSKLIKEKNNIISSNKSLECWYLGFERNNMKCSIVDNNIIEAYLLGIELEDYITFKEDYLCYFCNSIINHVLLCKMDDFDRIKGEIRLLAVLLDMDCVTLENSYKCFQELIEKNSFKNNAAEFVDKVFAKHLELVKKKNDNKI